MTILRSILIFCTTALIASAAFAAPPDSLPQGATGLVATVIDGDTVRLKDGSADIRLVGTQAPKLPLGRKGFKTWPLAEDSKNALSALVQDRAVTLRLGTAPLDRNGRTLAHLVRDDGLWVQGEMLRIGFARVYTFPDNRKLAAEMFVLEAQARAAQRGIWAHPFYAVRDATSPKLMDDVGTFQIVSGTVRSVAPTKDRTYINFGDDFRSDFTASIEKRDLARFKDAKLNLSALKDRLIEVRGWLTARNGPMIEVTHPEQIFLSASK